MMGTPAPATATITEARTTVDLIRLVASNEKLPEILASLEEKSKAADDKLAQAADALSKAEELNTGLANREAAVSAREEAVVQAEAKAAEISQAVDRREEASRQEEKRLLDEKVRLDRKEAALNQEYQDRSSTLTEREEHAARIREEAFALKAEYEAKLAKLTGIVTEKAGDA